MRSDVIYRFRKSFSIPIFPFKMLEVGSRLGCGNSHWIVFSV